MVLFLKLLNRPVKVEEDHSNGDDGKAEYNVVLREPHAKDEEGKTDQQAGAADDRITEHIYSCKISPHVSVINPHPLILRS